MPARFNIHFFDKIDSEAKAYFLGLLGADGCNTAGAITLALIDKDIIETFRLHLESENKIQFRRQSNQIMILGQPSSRKDMYALSLQNKYFVQMANKRGIVPRKSLIYKFPEWMPEELLHHYIRGYYDGDGSISYSWRHENTNLEAKVSLLGTTDFCESVQNKIESLIGIKTSVHLHGKNGITARLNVLGGKPNILKFLDWLYKDATIFLQRKYDKYIDYKTQCEEFFGGKPNFGGHFGCKITKAQKRNILKLYSKNSPISKIANLVSVSESSVNKVLKEFNIKKIKKIPLFKNKELIEKVISMYKNNKKLVDISKILEIGEDTISKILDEANISRERNRKKPKGEEEKEIIRLYIEEDKSVGFLSRKFDRGDQSITNTLKRNGISIKQRPPEYKLIEAEQEELIELYKSGETLKGIGEKFGVSETAVLGYLKRKKVPRKTKRLLEEEKKEVIEKYSNKEVPVKELAQEFKVSKVTILNILKSNNIPLNASSKAGRKPKAHKNL